MVYRALAGFIPMLLGALIWTGAIPVRQWVFGKADPVQAIAAAAASSADGRFPMPGEVFRESSMAGPAPTMNMNPDQARLIQEQAQRTQAELRRHGRQQPRGPQAGSWRPSDDWSAQGD